MGLKTSEGSRWVSFIRIENYKTPHIPIIGKSCIGQSPCSTAIDVNLCEWWNIQGKIIMVFEVFAQENMRSIPLHRQFFGPRLVAKLVRKLDSYLTTKRFTRRRHLSAISISAHWRRGFCFAGSIQAERSSRLKTIKTELAL